MKITFLGSGSAFVNGSENYHSNILIEENDKKMLFDCGTTINDALHMNGTDVMDIDKVFISHLHGDHSYGLEYVGFKTYFSTFPFGEKKVEIITTPTMLEDVWNKQLSASMDSLEGIEATINTYFKTTPLDMKGDQSENFLFEGVFMQPVKTIHSKMESYGLYIEDYRIFITGDTKFTPDHLSEYYEKAHVIFQDCEFNEYPNGVHAQFHELKTLDIKIKSKMFLYHYMLNGKTFEELEKEVLDAGFAGLIKRGEVIFDD